MIVIPVVEGSSPVSHPNKIKALDESLGLFLCQIDFALHLCVTFLRWLHLDCSASKNVHMATINPRRDQDGSARRGALRNPRWCGGMARHVRGRGDNIGQCHATVRGGSFGRKKGP